MARRMDCGASCGALTGRWGAQRSTELLGSLIQHLFPEPRRRRILRCAEHKLSGVIIRTALLCFADAEEEGKATRTTVTQRFHVRAAEGLGL